MPLDIVATPIGNPKDISLRALESLREADYVIGEELKVCRRMVSALGLPRKEWLQLNEHSGPADVSELVEYCKNHKVALISDCGTPSFCDPGFQLVKECRKQNIKITSLPGASSLMTLISMSSQRLNSFHFIGFLPSKTDERQMAVSKLKNHKEPFILMDTPYRLERTLDDLSKIFPDRLALLGINLTAENEKYLEGPIQKIKADCPEKKAEFIILVY